MLIINSFGKNIYIEKQLVGYIGENALYVSGRKFADLSDDGIISINKMEIGYVDDDGSILIRDMEVGYINDNNDFVFYKTLSTTILGGK
jgi:hypothetical protein